jgi:hypothetical protein
MGRGERLTQASGVGFRNSDEQSNPTGPDSAQRLSGVERKQWNRRMTNITSTFR